jgi:hypothetical protein
MRPAACVDLSAGARMRLPACVCSNAHYIKYPVMLTVASCVEQIAGAPPHAPALMREPYASVVLPNILNIKY